jgi:NADP-dependent 3-hydroxy acid dehydrogenase YdfG
MLRSLEGKVAWVTGAGTGIGRGGAEALAEAGMTVVLSGRRREPLEQVAAAIAESGGKAEVAPLDIADRAAVDDCFAGIEARHGRLDVQVNNAAINIKERRWHQLTPESWKTMVDIDLNGVFYCVHAALPIMRAQKDGVIVNISSWAGRFASYVSGPSYSTVKHAVVAMTQTLNMEEGRNGIRACVICPAEVATPILDNRPVPISAEEMAKMLQPEDLGETIRFVAALPPRVSLAEILIAPTWNRNYLGAPDFRPPWPPVE